MKSGRIFVHGLKAHADEMWACGLLIASKPDIEFTEIIRDAKRINEAVDSDFVIDCGMKFDGSRFFDHHQFKNTDKVECALTLVAKTFAPWVLHDEKYAPLIERVRMQDNYGIPTAEQKFGNSSPWIVPEFTMVNLFEREPLKIANIVADGFRRRLSEIDEIKKVKEWIAANSHIEMLGGGVRVFVCETSPFKAGFSIQAYNAASRDVINENRIEVAYGWNGDGSESRTLYRTGLGKEIDFTKAEPEKPVFCHNGGFLLVFDPADDAEYGKIVLQACDFDEKNKKSA